MNYVLRKCTIAGTVDRIRGEELITVPVTCTFEVNTKLYEMIGVASCNKATEIQETVHKAIANAETNLMNVIDTTPSSAPSSNNKNLAKFLKITVEPKIPALLKASATDRNKYTEMMNPATEDKQSKILGLCEALGIDVIDIISTEWSNVEALVLINYLERMTEPLSGDQ